MKRRITLRSVIKTVSSYLIFFITVGFAVTCCMVLFLHTLSDSLGIEFTEANIAAAAKYTFLNVLLISLAFALMDFIRRKITVERPARRITQAAERLMQGDFSVRIKPMLRFYANEDFNDIIDCFNRMAEELSGVETLRGDFIASVSHEMKTPLAVISNYGTLLQSPDISEAERIEYAKAITDGTRRLSDMMTNILKLNRLENQQIYPQNDEFDLSEQLCECILRYENVWENAEIELETEIEDGVAVRGDPELLSLVWNNLLSNAFKFTPRGGRVRISLSSTDGHAVVSVTDTGCGMTPEVGARMFEKFYQGDTSRATQGNGLGLSLVKRVVDIVQGEITVTSAVGEGSTFTVRIRRNLR